MRITLKEPDICFAFGVLGLHVAVWFTAANGGSRLQGRSSWELGLAGKREAEPAEVSANSS